MTKSFVVAGLIAAATFAIATSAHAQSLLDQQLGGPPAPPAPAASPAAKPEVPEPKDAAPPAATPPLTGNEITSPDAVKKVDDADLINKLTRTEEAPKGPPIAQQMSEMIDRMGQSEKRLTGKDAGDVTQETQRRILTDLDVLIEFARQQQQQNSQSQSQSPPQPQDQQKSYSQGQQNQQGTTAATDSNLPTGNAATPRLTEDIHSRGPNEWGGLRLREREMISHGANEEYLSAYRDMIDRYYQALAELGKSRNR